MSRIGIRRSLILLLLLSTLPVLSFAADPFDPDVAFATSEKESDAGRYAEASDEASKALASAAETLPPNDDKFLRLVSRHAHYAIEAKRIGAAEKDLAILLGNRPHNVVGLTEACNLLRELSRLDEGLLTVRRALAIAPDDPETLAAAARTYSSLGRYDESILAFQAAMRNGHDNYSMRIELANTYRLAGRFAEAAHLFQDAKEKDLRQASNYYEVGYSRLFSGQAGSALGTFQRKIAANPNDPMAHHHYGAFLFQIGRIPEAESEFKLALSLHRKATHPDTIDLAHTLIWLGRIEGNLGRSHEAFRYMSDAQQACVPFSFMWAVTTASLGGLLVSFHRENEGLASIEKALDSCNASKTCSMASIAVLLGKRAAIFLKRGDEQKSRDDLARVLTFVKKKGFRDIAECISAVGQAGDAMDLFKEMGDWRTAEYAGIWGLQAGTCAPDETDTVQLQMKLGELYQSCGDHTDAAFHWQEALKSYQRLGNSDEAAKVRTLLAVRSPDSQPQTPCGLMEVR